MPAGEVIASYHDLWHVEQSFRMSKTDLRARPMFHHTRDAIEAHLTIVFTALAVAPRGPGPHRPGHPQRHPPTTAAALSDHRDQRHRPDLPARDPHRQAGHPRRDQAPASSGTKPNDRSQVKHRTAGLNLRNLIGRGLTRTAGTWTLAT